MIDWSVLQSMCVIGFMVTAVGGMGTFVLLILRVGELNRDGDRRLPRFHGNLFFLWPPIMFEWLGKVMNRSRGEKDLKTDFVLARTCRALSAGFYLLWAVAVAAHVVVIANQ